MTHPGHDHRFGHWIHASAGMTGEKVIRHSRESWNPESYELPLSSTSTNLAQKWVTASLLTDGGGRTVTRIANKVITQRKQTPFDRRN